MNWHSTARWVGGAVGLGAATLGGALGFVGCYDSSEQHWGSPPPMPMDDAGPIFADAGPVGPPPHFGETTTQAKSPPPLSGGTLLLAKDDTTAVAADPDRDAVHVVDVAGGSKLATIALSPGDEPGRSVEDAARRVHVLLRGGGAVVTIDLASNTVVGRRQVCAAPRGIAYDDAKDSLHVACAGGELVTMPAAGGAPTRTVDLGRDLRDVLVVSGKVWVSRFRSASVMQLADDGSIASEAAPRKRETKAGTFSSAVAWRMIRGSGDSVSLVHQEGQDTPISTGAGGYGGGIFPCGGILRSVVTTLTSPTSVADPSPLVMAVLPVDIAYDASGARFAVIAAGNAHTPNLGTVFVYDRAKLNETCSEPSAVHTDGGEPTSVVFRADGSLVVQSRQPSKITLLGTDIPAIGLSDVSVADTGHAVFHANSGNNIACASCHPEGGDDARTWQFEGVGPRRTQTFRGGLTGSEPFHWDGDMQDLKTLMTHVFEGRMSGPHLRDDQLDALRSWIDHIPQIPQAPPKDLEAVARGKALFTSASTQCATCHAGARLTNHKTVDVGTGGDLQVPSLIGVSFRAPFLHTGCATTLRDRFGACGGGEAHGRTAALSTTQLDDLLAYLQSL